MAMKSDPIGKALAEALGVPPELVYRVRLDVRAGNVLSAQIDFYPEITEAQLAEIIEALRQQRTIVSVAIAQPE
jgi:hypothetical protein